MFKSIRWKFITIYFLLVFIAMVIVGVFIVEKIEESQIAQITDDMESTLTTIRNFGAIQQNNWLEGKEDIKSTIGQISLPTNQNLYIIRNSDDLEIISNILGNITNKNDLFGQSAYVRKEINTALVFESLKGDQVEHIPHAPDEYDGRRKHIVEPITNTVGEVKGVIYLTADLEYADNTVNESKAILTKATLLALVITVLLGFFIARSITGPINDVTVKAEKMAKGDFDQFVEIKSDDEIGQLASMFNYLTQKLKRTISEVYKEKSKMDRIFTYMADGVMAVNMNGEIIHANPVVLDMLNITYETIKDKSYDEIFRDLNHHITLKHLTKGDQWEGTEIIELESGTYRGKYAPFKNEKNEIGGLIIVFQDITEIHKLENMRKEFVANVSHELKTPITTIKSYTETLLDGALENKDLALSFLKVINGESDRMARIVRDLLQLSNLDYKQTKWERMRIDIPEMLRDIYLKMNIAAKEKNQNLTVAAEEDVPPIMFDKDGLEQVILNIVSNAIKYTPNNGKIAIIANITNNQVVVKVKDNGIGIPEQDLDRIFERFYRVDKARSRELGGTGLGLSIASQIIEAHNGRIVINSEYDIGTEVDIILPIE